MSKQQAYLTAMGIDVWVQRGTIDMQTQSVSEDSELALAAVTDSSATSDNNSADPIASVSMDWEQLQTAVNQCTACPLHQTRTQAVFGVGDRNADWMIIGEAPGADEDRLGEPFVGRAGKLLDLMLRALGIAREQVYIANILKSRPPNNRDPAQAEMQACWPYLLRQIELVQPKLMLAMGRIAAQSLLDTQTAVGKLRGQVHQFAGRPLIVTYHPAYLLRSPQQKSKSWIDLQLALRTFQSV